MIVEREIEFRRDGMRIAAKMFSPEGKGPFSIIVLAPGLGKEMTSCESLARMVAGEGISACCFDFIGGSRESRSSGCTTEMSVLTEAADMDAVLEGLRMIPEVESDNLFLAGMSQGGFVATYVAARHPRGVRGLIPLYPAYNLQDDARKRVSDSQSIPETIEILNMTVGRIYTLDAVSFDLYEMMTGIACPVLIIHGEEDPVAPISYSERAVKQIPHAELIRIKGAGHGLKEIGTEATFHRIVRFIKGNQTVFEC